MSYVQVQTNRDGEGREATYVHVATSECDAVKRRSAQRRLYIGKLDPGGADVLLSKGFGSGGGARVAQAAPAGPVSDTGVLRIDYGALPALPAASSASRTVAVQRAAIALRAADREPALRPVCSADGALGNGRREFRHAVS